MSHLLHGSCHFTAQAREAALGLSRGDDSRTAQLRKAWSFPCKAGGIPGSKQTPAFVALLHSPSSPEIRPATEAGTFLGQVLGSKETFSALLNSQGLGKLRDSCTLCCRLLRAETSLPSVYAIQRRLALSMCVLNVYT